MPCGDIPKYCPDLGRSFEDESCMFPNLLVHFDTKQTFCESVASFDLLQMQMRDYEAQTYSTDSDNHETAETTEYFDENLFRELSSLEFPLPNSEATPANFPFVNIALPSGERPFACPIQGCTCAYRYYHLLFLNFEFQCHQSISSVLFPAPRPLFPLACTHPTL
jgi:hypothetical protein